MKVEVISISKTFHLKTINQNCEVAETREIFKVISPIGGFVVVVGSGNPLYFKTNKLLDSWLEKHKIR